jgi:hypothetical protein
LSSEITRSCWIEGDTLVVDGTERVREEGGGRREEG